MSEADNKKRNGSMGRRKALKVISAVPAAAWLPLPAVAGRSLAAGKAARGGDTPPAAAAYKLQILSKHEYETVRLLSDIIIPADERTGSASEAGVPEFIDDWLNFWQGDMLAEIRGGLTWLDIESNEKYGHDFVACSDADRKELLDRIAYPNTAAPEDSNGVAFFNRLRDLVVGGFYSSETGVKDLPYLGNKVVEHWEGCPADVMAKVEENMKKAGLKL